MTAAILSLFMVNIFFKVKRTHSLKSDFPVIGDLLRIADKKDSMVLKRMIKLPIDHIFRFIRKIDNDIPAQDQIELHRKRITE
jgi:hypothetical protein